MLWANERPPMLFSQNLPKGTRVTTDQEIPFLRNLPNRFSTEKDPEVFPFASLLSAVPKGGTGTILDYKQVSCNRTVYVILWEGPAQPSGISGYRYHSCHEHTDPRVKISDTPPVSFNGTRKALL